MGLFHLESDKVEDICTSVMWEKKTNATQAGNFDGSTIIGANVENDASREIDKCDRYDNIEKIQGVDKTCKMFGFCMEWCFLRSMLLLVYQNHNSAPLYCQRKPSKQPIDDNYGQHDSYPFATIAACLVSILM